MLVSGGCHKYMSTCGSFPVVVKSVLILEGQLYVLLEGLRSNVSKSLLSLKHLPSWKYRRVIKQGTRLSAPEICVVITCVTHAWAVVSRTWTDERNFLHDEWTQRRSAGTLSKCRRTGKVTRSDLLRVGKSDDACIVSVVMEKRSLTVNVF
jgi:hypothetical protein